MYPDFLLIQVDEYLKSNHADDPVVSNIPGTSAM